VFAKVAHRRLKVIERERIDREREREQECIRERQATAKVAYCG